MFLIELVKKIIFDIQSDRIGPDLPFTHWNLYFPSRMKKLCKKKFKYFSDSAVIRPGSYIVGTTKISIGDRVIIRPGTRLFGDTVEFNSTITIEDDVMLGSGVHIYVHNHSYNQTNIPIIDQGHGPLRPVLLKKGSWIGANTIILPGVTIGNNSVVGAGSIVVKSIPDNVIAAGNPASIIKILSAK